MNEETAAAFQREGDPAFAAEGNAEDTASESRSEEENQDGKTQSDQGENNTGTEEVPFHEHPRWKAREKEWNDRFNDQETRHQNDLKSIREEFSQARKENAQNTKIPAWFGGTQEQWDAYRADRDAELHASEDRVIERFTKEREQSSKAEQDAVKDATDYMRTEMASIESDKTLNPSGVKFDQKTAETLLQTVLDNQLIDTKGRWNYRAGFRLMMAGRTTEKKPDTTEKKKVAAATTSEGKADDKKPTYATSADFKKDRPW